MANVIQQAIREPSTENAAHYAQRVHRLAAAYTALFAGSVLGLGLLLWQAQLYVTLAQRSNVETLTLAFFLLFFAYLAALSFAGARGACRILAFAVQVRGGADWSAVEQR